MRNSARSRNDQVGQRGAPPVRPWQAVPPLPNVDASGFQGGVARAIERTMAGAKAHPSDPESTLAVCMVLHAHDQYQAAGQCYARTYALDPKRFDTLYCWGHVLAADGAYAVAAVRLKQALAIRPESLPAQLKLAEVLTDTGDTSAYRRILASAPDEPRAHYGLGRALSGDTAMTEFRKSLALFPRFGAAQFALAAAYRREGDETKAQEILRDYERDKLLLPPLSDPEMAAVRSLNVSTTGLMQRAASEAMEGRLDEVVSLDDDAVYS